MFFLPAVTALVFVLDGAPRYAPNQYATPEITPVGLAYRVVTRITEGGMQVSPPGPTGVAIAINFQPTGSGWAAITGDFVLTAEAVNPVIKALRANNIEVTAIYSHILAEQPRLIAPIPHQN